MAVADVPSDAGSISPVSEDAVAALVAERYGIDGSVKRLAGEKDSNFRVATAEGVQYLLKVVHPSEEAGLTNMHTRALLHVARRDPTFPVQRVVCSLEGHPEFREKFGQDERTVRLVTFTPGTMQRNSTQTSAQRFNVGAMLARLQRALEGFSHPSDSHPIAWDLKNAAGLRNLIAESMPAENVSELVRWIGSFETDVIPRIAQLPVQVVHNDLNSDNVVVDPSDTDKVAGIIDFGDMVRTVAMFDVGVGAAYQLTEAEDPLAAAGDFIRGFHSIKPLGDLEIELLFKTIMTRMVMRIAIPEWHARRYPENRAYIMRNTPQVRRQFRILSDIAERDATSILREMLR